MAGLGVGGYYYLSGKYAKEKKDLESEIESLEAKLGSSASTSSSSSTSASSTSGLTSYSNSHCGFSVSYPSTLYSRDYFYDRQTSSHVRVGEFLILNTAAMDEKTSYVANAGMPTPYFMISCQDEEHGLSSIKSGLTETITDITLDGEAGWKVVLNEPSIMDETYSGAIYANHNGKGYQITWKNSDAAGTHDAAIDSIIATFNFTS